MVVKLRNKFYLNANYSSIFKFLSMNFNQYFSLTPKKGKKYTCKALILINIFFFIISFEKVLADTVSSSSDTSFDSDVDLQGDIKENRIYDITNSSVYTLRGNIISSSYNLTKNGNGTLSVTSNNDGNFSSSITVNAGILAAGDNDAFGSATIILNSGSLSSSNTTARNLSNTIQIQNSSSLGDASNNGVLTLSGSLSFTDKNLTLTSLSNNSISSINLATDPQTLSVASGVTSTITGAVSNGILTKSGAGSLVLAGTNTYDGETIISAGTLEVQGTLGNGNYSGNITNSATMSINSSSNQTLSGTISGSGVLSKNGSGTLTLTGTNTYSGQTTIEGGTVVASNSSSLGATPGSVTSTNIVLNNGTLQTTNSFSIGSNKGITVVGSGGTINTDASTTFTYGGVISSNGTLTKTGDGTLTLSGANTYTGNTTVSAGTLTVSGTLSDSTAITVASGATYDVDASDTIASVDGAGAIEIANAVTLTTGDANDQELSGTVSGSGSITKVGNGILTLSGTNSYSGDTTISAGTLLVTSQLGGGSYAGDISNAGDLGINSSNNQTLSGVISGSGTINKSGSGELTLTGANTFDGTINIAGGTLFAGGSSDGSNKITEGNIIVKGGTLSGSGIIDGNVTFSSTAGTLAPGNSIGTLTIDDNLTLSADDTTNIEFNLTTADKIVINGNTELAGTISLYPEDTTYSDVTHTIVDASGGGTFNGTFSTEIMNNESNLNDATWDIVYDTSAKTVSLQIAEAASACNINCTTTVSSSKDIAKVFDNATSGTLKAVKDVLDSSTVSSVNTELDKLKGTVMATSSIQSNTNHNYFNKAVASTTSLSNTTFVTNFTSTTNELTLASLQDQGLYGDKKKYSEYYDYSDVSVLGFIKNNKNKSFFERFESDDRASFLRTFGTNTKRDNIGEGYTGYNSDTAGILFGEQFKKDEINFNGYSIGISKTDTTYNDSYGDAEIYTMHSSMFKQIDEDDYAFNLLGSAFVSKTNSNRNVSVFGTSVDDKYKSDFYDVGLNLEVQHIAKYDFDGYKISPSAKINYSYIFKGDTKETGGDLALSVDNEDLFIIKPEVGISISKNFSEKDNKLSQLELAAFVSRDYFIEGTENKARFASGSTFNHDLPRDKEDYYSLGVGYNFLNKENNSSLMANAFLLENTKEDISSNIFSITFRKFFGEFAKGRIPSVIAKKDIPVKSDQDQNDNEEQTKVVLKKDPPMKSDKDLEQNNEVISSDNEIGKDETIIATFPDQNINNDIKKSVEDKIKNFEKKIEIVLKENPTKEEVEEIYISLNNEMRNSYKRDLTLDDVYNNLFANCYVVEKNLKRLINYYDKLQLYQILDKCSQLKDPKVHLIANRLHDIQMEERSAIEILYLKYLKILNYIPIITFIALIIFFYEIIRRFIVSYHNSRIIS